MHFIVFLHPAIFKQLGVGHAPRLITWRKRNFYKLLLRPPNGINLIMFRDSSVTFSAKIRKKIEVRFLV